MKQETEEDQARRILPYGARVVLMIVLIPTLSPPVSFTVVQVFDQPQQQPRTKFNRHQPPTSNLQTFSPSRPARIE